MLLQSAHVEKILTFFFTVVYVITDFISNDQMLNHAFTLVPN